MNRYYEENDQQLNYLHIHHNKYQDQLMISYAPLEKQLDDLIKNANKEEDKERFKALKILADYYKPTQISTSFDPYVDGRYDLRIDLIECCRRFT